MRELLKAFASLAGVVVTIDALCRRWHRSGRPVRGAVKHGRTLFIVDNAIAAELNRTPRRPG